MIGINTGIPLCQCTISATYLLPCRHQLLPFARAEIPIPRPLLHPRWWIYGPTYVQHGWEHGTGLTFEELNPSPVECGIADLTEARSQIVPHSIALLSSAVDGGQSLIERTALDQEAFRCELGPEDAQRFSEIKSISAAETRAGFQPVRNHLMPAAFPPLTVSHTKQQKVHGKAKARGMTQREIVERQVRKSGRVAAGVLKASKEKNSAPNPRATKRIGPSKTNAAAATQAVPDVEMLDSIVVGLQGIEDGLGDEDCEYEVEEIADVAAQNEGEGEKADDDMLDCIVVRRSV